jgi:bacillithiol system protein YtxJ
MFDFFFKNKNDNYSPQRIEFINENQLDEIMSLSSNKQVLIFKHSTRCGISTMILRRFEKNLTKAENDIEYYFLDLIKNRYLSNFVAEKLHVVHESPQIIVIKNGQVVTHDSHFGILDVTL